MDALESLDVQLAWGLKKWDSVAVLPARKESDLLF
jgi:hypothetical protein